MSREYFTNGISYEERTRSTLMDGEGYVTALLNAQERPQHVSMRPTNKMFDKLYKSSHPQQSRKARLNKLMNDTMKNSSPQFYVEQQFRSSDVEQNNGRYEFKLDPNFMACNSVYKTLALRGIYMRPKRYKVNYGVSVKLALPAEDPVETEFQNPPTFDYDEIFTKYWGRYYRVSGVKAIIEDDEGFTYNVEYYQDYKYSGPAFQDWTPQRLIVKITDTDDNTASVDIRGTNKIEGISINEMKIDFEFMPHGYAKITKHYTEDSVHYTSIMEVVKTDAWETTTTTCDTTLKKRTIQESQLDPKAFQFNITLLPENSIEVFAYEIVKQINEQLEKDKTTVNNEQVPSHFSKCQMKFEYDKNSNSIVFWIDSTEQNVSPKMKFCKVNGCRINDRNEFYYILNQTPLQYDPDYEYEVLFNNVWDREFFFVHASFMNLIQYNQLGRTNEIYPKPTKLTKYTSSVPDIEFWTSLNGIDPFVLIDQDFEVDLALAATLNNADITF